MSEPSSRIIDLMAWSRCIHQDGHEQPEPRWELDDRGCRECRTYVEFLQVTRGWTA